MGLFRRKATGKHALGAAVTSIPSGPLRLAAPALVTPAAAPLAPPVHGDLVPAPPAAAPARQPLPVEVPAQAPSSARASLETALAQLLPLQGGATDQAAPQALRVQLGFRDGTSTTLDPASSQAQALEQLAQSLTRRD